jgi:hypothetical protein
LIEDGKGRQLMNASAKTIAFWLIIVVCAILLWQGAGRQSYGTVEIAIGFLCVLGAAWPFITGRRMQLRPLFLRAYPVPLPVQIGFQLLTVVAAGWFWWHGAIDLAAKR